MSTCPLPDDPVATNLAWWQAAARAHRAATSGYYDPAPLLAGQDQLTAHEEAALARALPDGVRGRAVLHLQCHLALDGIRLARRGAAVTGLDFSSEALAGAADLAARCGVRLDLVQADATCLPPALHGRFDLVWATIGVLTWHRDLGAWMRAAAAALRPGGHLLLHELHPLFTMPASTAPLVIDFPYLGGTGHAFAEAGTYAAPGAELGDGVNVSFAHGLGEVVTAAVEAGLRVERLEEHLEVEFDPRADLLVREQDGRYRWRPGGPGSPPVPVLFTLIAQRRDRDEPPRDRAG